MKKLYINGRFLTQNITGVQRVGIEVVKELDRLVKDDEVELLTPPGKINGLELQNIKVTVIGKKSNNWWTQWTFPMYVKKQNGISLTISGLCAVIKPDYFLIHDTTFKRYPKSFNWKFRVVYDLNYKFVLKRCKHLFTVSGFSKNEVNDVYKIPKKSITVVYNSSHQLLESHIEKNVDLRKWGIENQAYFLSVGSKNIHKNQIFIEYLAEKHPRYKFVIVGGEITKSFKAVKQDKKKNVIYTGYVNDEELKKLYKEAKGFIFPSLYEGFGIPPLEAITMGCKHVAVSDIPIFKEIYTQGVYFFDPTNVSEFCFNDFCEKNVDEKIWKFYWEKYSWTDTAETIWKKICECEKVE